MSIGAGSFVFAGQTIEAKKGGIVVQTPSGQTISLGNDQYLFLEDGLVLIPNQLAQNSTEITAISSGLIAKNVSGTPVESASGQLVKTTHLTPLWSGARGSISDLNIEVNEFAQNVFVDAAEEVSPSASTSWMLGAGASLSALIVGLFGFSPKSVSETPEETGNVASLGGPTTYSGTVIKGPLLNAFVFLDENGNGVFDTGEPNFTTSASGGFSISSSAANPKLIVITDDRTIDTTTGNVFSGMTFKAPKEAKVISPLTTMMEETGLNLAEIKSVFGLPATVNPLTFNPYAPGVNPADALAAEQVSAQTMVTLAAFAAAAAGTGISQQDAFAAALSALSSVMQSKNSGGGTLDLTDPTDLAAVQSAFTTAVGSIPGVTADQTTAINGIIGDATTAIQNVNNKIASITNTDLNSAANGNIFGLLQVLQDQVEKAAEDEKTTPGSGTIGFTDPTAVDNAATNSAPTDIDLSASSISEDASSLVVGVLTTTDDSTSDFNFTYEIAEIGGSNDHSAFSINQANGELSFVSQPDFETQSSYTITIIATDEGGKSFSETFTISITDSDNENLPTFTSDTTANFSENGTGTVYTAVAIDADGDTTTYHLIGGADQGLFNLDSSSGALTFKSAPDYETPTDASLPPDNVYEVQIEARDGNGGTVSQTVSITVTDVDDAGLTTVTLGVKDEYSSSNGDEASPRTTSFDTVLSGQTIDAYFDNTQTNSSQGFSFDLSGVSGTITSATLKLSAKPLNDSGAEDNDTIRLWGNDPSSGEDWATFSATGKTVGLGWDAGPNNYFNFDWRYNKAETIGDPSWDVTLDLSNFSAQEGTGLSLISDIDQNKILNVLVGDDTIVDYAELDLISDDNDAQDEPNIISHFTSSHNLMDVEIAPDLDSNGMAELVIHRKVAKYDRQAFVVEDALLGSQQTIDLDSINSEYVLTITGLRHSSRLDLHSDFLTDINGDGIPELILGDHDSSTGGNSLNGQVYFVSGSELINRSGSLSADSIISNGGLKIYGEKYGDYLGWSISTLTDDRTGTSAESLLLASAERSVSVAAGSNKGGLDHFSQSDLVQIFSANGQGSSINISSLSSYRNEIQGISIGDGFPSDARNLGDLDQDGVEDLILLPRWGSYQQTAFISAADLIDGNEVDLDNLSQAQGYIVANSGFQPKGSFSIDDMNDDSFADAVIFTNHFDAGSGVTGGTIFVLKSGTFFANASNPDQWSGDGNITLNSAQGIYLSDITEVPDVSGDGISEIAFGANSITPADKTGIYIIYSEFLSSASGDYTLESLTSDQLSFIPTSKALYDFETGNFDTDTSPELVVTTADGNSVYIVNMDKFDSWTGGDLF